MLLRMTSQRTFVRQMNHQNLPHIPYLNHYDTQVIKTRKGPTKQRIIFFPRQQTQSTISPTIPKQQTTGLTNILSIKHLDIMSIRTYFRSRCNEFKAGKLKHYFLSRKSLLVIKRYYKQCWVWIFGWPTSKT